jgi:predicted membrane protein
MNNETVKCPFCFKESELGVRICTGCHSKITYGTVSGWSALLIIFILLAISYIILYISQSLLVAFIAFFVLVISTKKYIRKKFAHRAVFTHQH